MNQIEGMLLLAGIPLGLLLAGYWLAALFEQSDVPTRLSIALLTGIASLLLTVSIVNFFLPISGVAAWVCLAPACVTLFRGKSRDGLWRDLRSLLVSPSARGYAAIVALFFILILWPVLSSFTTVMFDGTSNHDSFFWVTVAEHLKRHTYMERPVWNSLQPLASAADAVVGWKPAWGRMGSEGLLALCSAVVGLSPLKLYVYVTACLYLPWLAAVHLSLRTFYAGQLSWLARVTVLLFHPIFIFFYSNANLPNLLGVIAGSTAIIATESALRAGWDRRKELWGWAGLLALSLHGVYCAYPEMTPFVFLPCGLLWLRACCTAGTRALWRPRLIIAGAVIGSLLLNPASSLRAGWGFVSVFKLTQVGSFWGNIFEVLHPVQYLPALVTLSAPTAIWLDILGGGLSSLLLVIGVVLACRRAHDLAGAILAFSGGYVLVVYTLMYQFSYGWQKSVQFTGIFTAALLSGALVDAVHQYCGRLKTGRALARLGTAALIGFLVFSMVMHCRELYKRSEQKTISQDWFALRDLSRTTLNSLPVLVEAASFRMAFYHGMWAAYFLTDSHIYYASRGEQSGGYLRAHVTNEATQSIPPPAAVLVGRAWADSLDANSPRILSGKEYVLLRKSNRVFTMEGVFPLNGLPDVASTRIGLEVLPHTRSQLLIELQPRKLAEGLAGTWQVIRRTEGADDFSISLSGAPPWVFKVPLISGQRNQITIVCATVTDITYPFFVKKLRIEDGP